MLGLAIAGTAYAASTGAPAWRRDPTVVSVLVSLYLITIVTNKQLRTMYPVGLDGTINDNATPVIVDFGIAIYVYSLGVAIAFAGSLLIRNAIKTGAAVVKSVPRLEIGVQLHQRGGHGTRDSHRSVSVAISGPAPGRRDSPVQRWPCEVELRLNWSYQDYSSSRRRGSWPIAHIVSPISRPTVNMSGMGKNTSFSLNEHSSTFIEAEVASGRYRSATDVVRPALRPLEERETRLNALRQALVTGENSGTAMPFDFDAFVSHKRAGGPRGH